MPSKRGRLGRGGGACRSGAQGLQGEARRMPFSDSSHVRKYTLPGGAHYGGTGFTAARGALEQIVSDHDVTSREQVLIIDYHPGLGRYWLRRVAVRASVWARWLRTGADLRPVGHVARHRQLVLSRAKRESGRVLATDPG